MLAGNGLNTSDGEGGGCTQSHLSEKSASAFRATPRNGFVGFNYQAGDMVNDLERDVDVRGSVRRMPINRTRSRGFGQAIAKAHTTRVNATRDDAKQFA